MNVTGIVYVDDTRGRRHAYKVGTVKQRDRGAAGGEASAEGTRIEVPMGWGLGRGDVPSPADCGGVMSPPQPTRGSGGAS